MNEFYAYWNAQQIRDLLEAIVFIVGGGDFLGLLRAIAIVGLLVVTTGSILSMRYEHSFLFLLGLAFFYMVLLLPKQSVTVRDVRAGTVYVVNNVPVGVAAFAAGTSHIGYWLTNIFETAFMPADDVARFSRFGLGFPQRAITAVQNLGAVTPQGREMLSLFVRDCVVAEMLESPAKANEVVRSADIWATLTQPGWLNPARTTVMTDGTVQTCPNMPGVISVYLANQEIPALREALGHKLVGDRPNPSAAITAALPQVEALLMGMSRTFEDSMRQAVMLEAIPNGITLAGASAEPLALAVNMSAAQANVSSVINYRTMANMAKNFLPSIRNAIEFVVIAAFPLIVLMVLAAGHRGGLVLKGFFVMVIWVQLWAPLYAVINYLMITVDANPLSQIQAAFGGNSLASVNLIREIGATSQDIAGMMSIMVPVVAYALAKSSEIATTSMISTVFAPASSAAQAMGSQLSQGNVSLGNKAWGNVNANNASANKHDMSTSWTSPGMATATTGGGTVTAENGRVTGVAAARNDLGASVGAGAKSELTNTASSGSSVTAAWTRDGKLDLQSAASGTNQDVARAASALAWAINEGFGGGTTWTSTAGASSKGALESSGGVSEQMSTSEAAGMKFGARIGGGGDSKGGKAKGGVADAPLAALPVTAGVGFDTNIAQQFLDQATGRTSGTTTKERLDAAQRVLEGVNKVLASNERSAVKEAVRAFAAEFGRRTTAALTTGRSVGGVETAGSTNQFTRGGSTDASATMGPALRDALIAHYGSAFRALEALNQDPINYAQTALHLARQVAARMQPSASSGLVLPTTPQDVEERGRKAVDAQHAAAREQVRNDGDEFHAQAKKRQPPGPPGAPPDQSAAMASLDKAQQAANGDLQALRGEVNVGSGAAMAGAALYRQLQSGVGTMARIAFLGAAGYQSGQQITDDLLALARSDAWTKYTLSEIGSGRIALGSDEGKATIAALAQRLKPTPVRQDDPPGEWQNQAP